MPGGRGPAGLGGGRAPGAFLAAMVLAVVVKSTTVALTGGAAFGSEGVPSPAAGSAVGGAFTGGRSGVPFAFAGDGIEVAGVGAFGFGAGGVGAAGFEVAAVGCTGGNVGAVVVASAGGVKMETGLGCGADLSASGRVGAGGLTVGAGAGGFPEATVVDEDAVDTAVGAEALICEPSPAAGGPVSSPTGLAFGKILGLAIIIGGCAFSWTL